MEALQGLKVSNGKASHHNQKMTGDIACEACTFDFPCFYVLKLPARALHAMSLFMVR